LKGDGSGNNRSIIATDLEKITNIRSIPWEKLGDKTVLITGAAGFLAAYMVETLLFLNDVKKLNVTVIAVVRSSARFNKRFNHHISRSDVIFVEHDISAAMLINTKVDFMIHAASQASPKFYATDPVGTLSANTMGTAHLLELARKNKVESFLYFSSAEVYGEAIHVPTSENDYGYLDPLAVRSCYAESKRMGENMCVSWHHQYGVPAKIVRPFHTYGPGMQLDDGRVYADFVSDVVNGKNITLRSNGLARRAFCYLADATAGFWMVLLCGESAQAYNIGNPDCEISIRDLAKMLAELYPEKKIKVGFEHREDTEQYVTSSIQVTCPNIDLAKKLGWAPWTSLEDGFRKTVESY
jgi:nucleoside-diphosphate-sugar epimerase